MFESSKIYCCSVWAGPQVYTVLVAILANLQSSYPVPMSQGRFFKPSTMKHVGLISGILSIRTYPPGKFMVETRKWQVRNGDSFYIWPCLICIPHKGFSLKYQVGRMRQKLVPTLGISDDMRTC